MAPDSRGNIIVAGGATNSAPYTTLGYTAPAITAVPTALTIGGTSFGPAGTPGHVTAAYGPNGQYVAMSCSTTSDTVITCSTAAGVGTGHVWTVSVGSQTITASSQKSDYGLPVISGVVETGPMPTLGGASVVLQGSNFGPIGVAFKATYGRRRAR